MFSLQQSVFGYTFGAAVAATTAASKVASLSIAFYFGRGSKASTLCGGELFLMGRAHLKKFNLCAWRTCERRLAEQDCLLAAA